MNRYLLIFAAALALVAPACVADHNGGEVGVSGTVHDQFFDAMTGYAERIGGDYIVVLTDDPDMTCTSNPTSTYLTVEMAGVGGSGTYGAAGNVTFNEVGAAGLAEGATSGSFSITVVEDDFGDEIVEGSIDAAGPTSSVSGWFEVPVCDPS